MHTQMGLFFPYLQEFSQELHPLQEELLCLLQTNNDGPLLVDNAGNISISDYGLGAGDLYKAPELIIEEPVIELDPVTAAISMMASIDDVITAEVIKVADMDPIHSEQLLSEILYDCNDLMARCAAEDTSSEPSNVNIPALQIKEEKNITNGEVVKDGPMQKSDSAGSLTSVDWTNGSSVRPNALDFQSVDLESVFGIRRTYSEGDIQTLGNGSMSNVNRSSVYPPFGRLLTIGDQKIEERRQKISRYRKKKTTRNFGRKIKYACRKALADCQPRVRGRFARAEECEASK